MAVYSKLPQDEFFHMSKAMDAVIYDRVSPTVGGFRVQATYDDGYFSYNRYQVISNEIIDIEEGRIGFTNAAKGTYNVSCAKGVSMENFSHS